CGDRPGPGEGRPSTARTSRSPPCCSDGTPTVDAMRRTPPRAGVTLRRRRADCWTGRLRRH
ncbi:MAG: hypothetical protein AVDCRST_MAG08-3782, partial [uncultured Acetobacteraceae bacterium]